MLIDKIYATFTESKDNSKSNFYFGKISKVESDLCKIQVENLTLIKNRNYKGNQVFMNNVDEYVLIDSVTGVYLAKIINISIKDSDSVHKVFTTDKKDIIFPVMNVYILGELKLLKDNNLKIKKTMLGNPNLNDKAFIMPEHMLSKIISLFNLVDGPYFENVFKISNGVDENINVSIDGMLNRHMMVVGTTGSGKSTTSLAMIENATEHGAKFLVIDPTGEYKELSNLKKDGEEIFNCITELEDIKINISDINNELWKELLNLNDNSQLPTLISAINSLQANDGNVFEKNKKSVDDVENKLDKIKENQNYKLDDLIKQIKEESVVIGKCNKYTFKENKLSINSFLIEKIKYFKKLGFEKILIEDEKRTKDLNCKLDNFIKNDKSLYIDCSTIQDDLLGKVIVSYIGKYFADKIHENNEYILDKLKNTPVVCFIDEIHKFIDENDNNFAMLAREGRKYGIFLFMTTQSPLDVSKMLISQVGTFIIHRLVHPDEVSLISKFTNGISKGAFKRLGQGETIISSVNLIDDINVKVEKSQNLIHKSDTPKICN